MGHSLAWLKAGERVQISWYLMRLKGKAALGDGGDGMRDAVRSVLVPNPCSAVFANYFSGLLLRKVRFVPQPDKLGTVHVDLHAV